MVTIIPYMAPQSYAWSAAASNTLPCISTAAGNTETIFSMAPYFSSQPFVLQASNIVTYQIDGVVVDYMCTQSPLAVTGRCTAAFYY